MLSASKVAIYGIRPERSESHYPVAARMNHHGLERLPGRYGIAGMVSQPLWFFSAIFYSSEGGSLPSYSYLLDHLEGKEREGILRHQRDKQAA
jgi:hypothetical protein